MYFCLNLKYDPSRIANINTVSELLQWPSSVKTRMDRRSTVVVEVASFVGNPVCTSFTMCTLIDPHYHVEGLFLLQINPLSIIVESCCLITFNLCTASSTRCTLLYLLISGVLPFYHS